MRFLKATLLLFVMIFASCNKSNDDTTTTPPNAYADQKIVDDAKILDFFDKYHMDVNPTTKDVTFTLIPTPNSANLQKIKDEYATQIQTRVVKVDGVEHNAYFISLREGDVNKKPTPADSVFVCYRGRLLDNTTFENVETLPTWFGNSGQGVTLRNLIVGWKEIFPYFGGSSSITSNGDGTYNYDGYGAGVMFIPSALAYYNVTQTGIPAYSPLIFSFKLMAVNYVDEDGDRIDSKYEMNYDSVTHTYTDRDTDGDGRYDAYDIDDDNDAVLTKYEIKNPLGGYYPHGELLDNSSTPQDDTWGIPDCSDVKTGTRVRKHLDKNCH